MRSVLRPWLAAMVLLCTPMLCAASTHILTPSPTSVSFGGVPVNTTTTQKVTVTNTGTGSVQIQSVSISGSTVFQVSGLNGTITLAPGQALALTASFTPTAVTSYSATLAVTATGGASKSVPLSGSGTGTTQVAITISPTSATVQTGNTEPFNANVTGTTTTGVNWLVNNMLNGNSTVGTITNSGLYTAPASVPSGGIVTVTAQSQADTTKTANATVTITAATATTTSYSNIDDSTTLNANGSTIGWGWCSSSSCAGGSGNATQKLSWGQSPSRDGNGSVQFMISGNAYADGLWWYKVGANDSVSNFKFDFWLNVSQAATTYSQALEFDVFQYISPTRYMFGTQCDYAANGYQNGHWDVWNAGANSGKGNWYPTGYACPAFVAGDWYHITWNFYRTSDLYEHYDSVTVEHYDSTGTLSSSTTNINLAFLSNALPNGWNDNMGVNFQLDINALPGSTGTAIYTTLVDEATLTVW